MESILFEASRLFAKSNIKKIKPYVSKEDYKIIIKWLNTGNPKLRSAELAWSAESVWSAWSERSAEKTKQERMLLKLMRDKFGDL